VCFLSSRYILLVLRLACLVPWKLPTRAGPVSISGNEVLIQASTIRDQILNRFTDTVETAIVSVLKAFIEHQHVALTSSIKLIMTGTLSECPFITGSMETLTRVENRTMSILRVSDGLVLIISNLILRIMLTDVSARLLFLWEQQHLQTSDGVQPPCRCKPYEAD